MSIETLPAQLANQLEQHSLPPLEQPSSFGPPVAAFSNDDYVGDGWLYDGGTTAESHGEFSTFRTNTCVFRGKWMYEAILDGGGVCQIGWALKASPFSLEARRPAW